MAKTRLCIISTSFPRFKEGDGVNGSFIHAQAKYLSERDDYEVTVITPHVPGLPSEEYYGKIKVVRFKYFFPSSLQKLVTGTSSGIIDNFSSSILAKIQLPFFLLSYILTVRKYIRKSDIIHAHWLIGGAVALIARCCKSIPIVMTVHHAQLLHYPEIMKKWVLKNVDAVISGHPELIEKVKERTEKPCFEVRNYSNYDIFPITKTRNEIRKSLGISDKSPVVIIVSRVTPGKGVITFVKAVPAVLKEIPDCHFVMIGDGPLMGEVNSFVENLETSNVHILGERNDVVDYLNASDIFVSTNEVENVWTVNIVEAALSGLPCVLTKAGSTAEYVHHEKDTLLYETNNDQELANALIDLLKHTKRKKQFAENFGVLIKKLGFSKDDITTNLIKIYEQFKK